MRTTLCLLYQYLPQTFESSSVYNREKFSRLCRLMGDNDKTTCVCKPSSASTLTSLPIKSIVFNTIIKKQKNYSRFIKFMASYLRSLEPEQRTSRKMPPVSPYQIQAICTISLSLNNTAHVLTLKLDPGGLKYYKLLISKLQIIKEMIFKKERTKVFLSKH